MTGMLLEPGVMRGVLLGRGITELLDPDVAAAEEETTGVDEATGVDGTTGTDEDPGC
jgi:hypothetical protein